MKNRKTIRNVALLCSATAVVALSSSQVFAAGFEKALFWDAHYSGIAGAAQSSVTGPQALYWNPAGLGGTEGIQVNGDFSPTLAKFNGNVPNVTNLLAAQGIPDGGSATGPFTTPVSSSTGFDPVGAVFASYQVTDKMTASIGYYVVGGTKANYDSVPLNYPSTSPLNPPLQGNLAITELGLGAGYEVLPGLKLGASYRITFFKADLDDAFVNPTNGTLMSLQYSGLSKTTFNGFKLGAMWEPKDAGYGFGLTWRSRVNVTTTTQNATLQTQSVGSPTTTTITGTGSAGLNLPMRLDAAAHYTFMPAWTGYLGYSFTNLSQSQQIGDEFDSSAVSFTNNIPLNWNNQSNIRVGLDYAGIQDWNLRAGYVWTNQVTPNGAALPILAAPGTGNTYVIGAGHKFSSMLTGDVAFEYDRDSGTVAQTDITEPSRTASGDYSAKDYVLHLSATLSL